jgi:hypothetical protein
MSTIKRNITLYTVLIIGLLLTACGGSDMNDTSTTKRISQRASHSDTIQKAYIAYYGRPADPGGLDYWAGRLESANGDLSALIDAFGSSDEFNSRFGSLSNSDLITNIYQQLYNRTPDSGGLAFYTEQLDTGNTNLQKITLDVLYGAQNTDLDKLNNKLTAANAFTENVRGGNPYPEASTATTFLASIDETAASLSSSIASIDTLLTVVEAVTGLKSGWTQSTIFSSAILYPKGIFKDPAGTVYTYSSTSTSSTMAKLSTNTLEKVFDVSFETQGWGYQPTSGRFITTTSTSGLYAVDSAGTATQLRMFGVIGNQIAVASDDTFYTCTGSSQFGVYKYDKDGNLLSTLASNVNVCSSIMLDNTETSLYYTSSVEGKLYKVELSTGTITEVASGLGIPGTSEPITIGFDSNNDLYVFSGADGLYKYNGSTFVKDVDSISGAGNIVWSASDNAFLMGVGAGANIVAYYTNTKTGAHLTENLNAVKIAQNEASETLICDGESQIEKVTATGFSTYISGLEAPCSGLTTDENDNVYAGLGNGKIHKLSGSTLTDWGNQVSGNIIDMAYSKSDNSVVVAYITGSSSVAIAKVTESATTVIQNLSGVTVTNAVPAVTADNSGNVYVLERKDNKLYKIDTSGTMTTIADNVLESTAITVPDIVYSSNEDGFIISTINDYKLMPLSTPTSQSTFATNNGSVDNFAMHVNKSGVITAIHSGQAFKMTPQ